MFAKEIYQQRRKYLSQKINSGILLFIGNEECGINYKDNTYEFRQDSTFLYYFGLPCPDLTAIIDLDDGSTIIFGDDLSIENIIWTGAQPSLQERSESVGVDAVLPSDKLLDYLKMAQYKGQKIHFLPYYRYEHSSKLWKHTPLRSNKDLPSTDFIKAVAVMRNHKSVCEIEEIERACNVTSDMHVAAMKAVREGVKEYEIAALVQSIAYSQRCRLSFQTIATVRGQILHNHYHGNAIGKEDMLLLDAGAETAEGYAGDFSSTIPAGRKFTSRQRDIYDIQIAAFNTAVGMLRPGVHFRVIYEKSAKIIFEGMKSLGIMKGDADDAVKKGAFAIVYPHGLGHFMGLDVHDMEGLGEQIVAYDTKCRSRLFGYRALRLSRRLEKDYVLTIEPGIYFIPELIDLWQGKNRHADFINYDKLNEYRDFGGIRNERNFLITAKGARQLGKKTPLTANEVEAIRNTE